MEEEAARTVELIGDDAVFLRTDVATSAECEALVAAALEHFGGLDVVHANAGIELPKNVWDTTDEDWNRVLEVNLSGVFWISRAAMTWWRELGRGGVLTITASPHAFATGKDIAAYAASKGGCVALMRALALEGAEHGIRANAILPGLMNTPMVRGAAIQNSYGGDEAEMIRRRDAQCPMGKMGDAWDVAYAALFLASDEAKYITGAELVVDGGLTCKVA